MRVGYISRRRSYERGPLQRFSRRFGIVWTRHWDGRLGATDRMRGLRSVLETRSRGPTQDGVSATDYLNDDIWVAVGRFLPPRDAVKLAKAFRAGRDAWSHRWRGRSVEEIRAMFSEEFMSVKDKATVTLKVTMSRSNEEEIDCFAVGMTLGFMEHIHRISFVGAGVFGASAVGRALANGAMANLVELRLNANKIGDPGTTALCGALPCGAMANLQELWLNDNGAGDAGATSVAEALSKGAMANLRVLSLQNNEIGDAGLAQLADATCKSKGALALLRKLRLANNRIGDAGARALADAAALGAMARLESLRLDNNQIGDEGVSALAKVLAHGRLNCVAREKSPEGAGTKFEKSRLGWRCRHCRQTKSHHSKGAWAFCRAITTTGNLASSETDARLQIALLKTALRRRMSIHPHW